MLDSRVGRPAAGIRTVPVLDIGHLLRRLDWLMLGAVAALLAYGLWLLNGITRDDIPGDPGYYIRHQVVYAVIGVVGLVLAVFVNPDVYRRRRMVIYVTLIGSLLLVLAGGVSARGSQRWISFGSFRFQPSEFGKLLLVLCLAAFLADRGRRVGEVRTTVTAIGIAAVPTALVFLQPDVGSALVYVAVLASVLFVAGTRWLHLGVLLAAAAIIGTGVLWAAPAAGVDILKPYQVQRLTSFTNPSQDPSGATYNVTQSQIAVGSGGATGRGVSGSTQTNFDYLPEHATDFVFASLAEQRGFVGATILLLLYLLVVWRALNTIAVARDMFSAIVAGGIAIGLLFQIVVNVGMTIGMAPVTGIPLPFVSAGGSSLIMNLIAIGILQAIHARGRLGTARNGSRF